jgi:signal transduction histidine kinase
LAHGGTLTAASQPGEGTRLTLTLPLSAPPRD